MKISGLNAVKNSVPFGMIKVKLNNVNFDDSSKAYDDKEVFNALKPTLPTGTRIRPAKYSDFGTETLELRALSQKAEDKIHKAAIEAGLNASKESAFEEDDIHERVVKGLEVLA